MKKLAFLLVAAGILTALYPLGERVYTWYWQQQLLSTWEETQTVSVSEALAEEAIKPADGQLKPNPLPEKPSSLEAPARKPSPLGILTINKINLELPVLQSATPANLRIGAGLLDDGADIGEKGTAVLTAHRSHTFGRQFNRLDELDEGDEIMVTTRDKVYGYTVIKKEIVKPDAITVQGGGSEVKDLVLITCHPMYSVNPPYRLVVRATLKN